METKRFRPLVPRDMLRVRHTPAGKDQANPHKHTPLGFFHNPDHVASRDYARISLEDGTWAMVKGLGGRLRVWYLCPVGGGVRVKWTNMDQLIKRRVGKLLDEIESCGFQCEAGALKGLTQWRELRDIVNGKED